LSVANYAQAQATYHGLKAGLTLVQAENGVFTAPTSWFVKQYNELVTSGTRQEVLRMVEIRRQQMVEAQKTFVERLTEVYGKAQQ
jgi:hypothetical protein